MEQTTERYAIKRKSLPGSKIEIVASIPTEVFSSYRNEALAHIGKEIDLPGFRKGHAPERMVAQRVGEAAILEEMAELAISRAYAEIIVSERIDAIGRPEVRITKIAEGNPLEFTLVTAVFPDISLGDYKRIASKKRSDFSVPTVTDAEIDETIERIRKMGVERAEAGSESSAGTPLPEFDDAFVKTLGDYENVADFRTKLAKDMKERKEREARDKHRVAIMETLIAESTIDLPEIIVEQEIDRMEDEFAHEVERMGMTLEEFLKNAKKNREELRKEWVPDAERRAKVQLIASRIAETEKLTPNEEDTKKECARLMEMYPDADEERVRRYVEMLLSNENVFRFLESIE